MVLWAVPEGGREHPISWEVCSRPASAQTLQLHEAAFGSHIMMLPSRPESDPGPDPHRANRVVQGLEAALPLPAPSCFWGNLDVQEAVESGQRGTESWPPPCPQGARRRWGHFSNETGREGGNCRGLSF